MTLLAVLEELLAVIRGDHDEQILVTGRLASQLDEALHLSVDGADFRVVQRDQAVPHARRHVFVDRRIAVETGQIKPVHIIR